MNNTNKNDEHTTTTHNTIQSTKNKKHTQLIKITHNKHIKTQTITQNYNKTDTNTHKPKQQRTTQSPQNKHEL